MAIEIKNVPAYLTMLAGGIVSGIAFYFWKTQPMTSKYFQLSNELVGAGIFLIGVGLVVRLIK